jgi:hypothetical protein
MYSIKRGAAYDGMNLLNRGWGKNIERGKRN